MRLSKEAIAALVSVFEASPMLDSSELFLFGSRVDDSKRGGDIDLLWVVSSRDLPSLIALKSDFKSKLSASVGEQRVDLVIANEERLHTDPFLSSITSKVRLHRFDGSQ